MSQESIKVASLLRDTKEAIRKIAGERDAHQARADAAEEKLAAVMQRLEVEKIAHEMHEKGLNSDKPIVELIAYLEKQAESGRLEVVKEAIQYSAPNMGRQIGNIDSDESRGAGLHPFEAFIVGGNAG